MLGRLRLDVQTAIDHYNKLSKDVFGSSNSLLGDGKFDATKLEKAIKFVVKKEDGNSESFLLEDDKPGVCKM